MGVRLPSAYQETEYIESTGTQWIDTGIVHGKFVHDIAFTADGRQLMGCHSTSSKFWGSNRNKASYELHAGRINTNTGKRNIVIYDNTNDPTISLTAVGVTETATITGPNPLPSYVLFRINNDNYYASARLYHISIYDIADDLIYDGIPCYRKSDSVAGLYDLVSRAFYPNQGTGEFLIGPDVIDSISPWLVARRRALMARVESGGGRLPAKYQEVEFLASTGTQYIALGLNGALDNGCFLLKFMLSDNTPGNSQLAGSDPSNNSLPKISSETAQLNLRQSVNNFVGKYSTSTLITLQTDSSMKVYVNGEEVGAINNVTTVGNGYNLFSVYPNRMQYAAKARIYNFKIWDNTSEKIDLVPCYRKSDSKPGMYDLITNTFFTNAGTGEFTVGADVN